MRGLQRSGNLEKDEEGGGLAEPSLFESCRSAVDHVEETSLESPRKRQDAQEVMGETAGNATRERGEDAWRLEPEGRTETLEIKVVSHGVEGVNVDPDGEGRHEWERMKKSRRQSEAPGEEGEETKSPKRKIIRVASEETQDSVRKAKDTDQEEAEEMIFGGGICFVVTISVAKRPSASGSLRRW